MKNSYFWSFGGHFEYEGGTTWYSKCNIQWSLPRSTIMPNQKPTGMIFLKTFTKTCKNCQNMPLFQIQSPAKI